MPSNRLRAPGGLPAERQTPRDEWAVADAHDGGAMAGDQAVSIWHVVRHNWLLIAACMLLAGVVAVLVTARITPMYEAFASLRIDRKPSQAPTVNGFGLAGDELIATEIEMLRSRALAETVVDSLGLQFRVASPRGVPREEVFARIGPERVSEPAAYRLVPTAAGGLALVDRASGVERQVVEPGKPTQVGGVTVVFAPTAAGRAPLDVDVHSFRAVVDSLQERVAVGRRNREANIIDVSYRDADPGVARDVPNVLAREFIRQRQAMLQADARASVRFLKQQVARASEQLAGAERSLRAFREREQIISLRDEASTGVTRHADLQAQRNVLQAERDALAAAVRAGRAPAAGAPSGSASAGDLLGFPTLLRSGVTPGLLAALNAAEERRSELLLRRSLQDRDVQLLTARITEIRGAINSLVGTYLAGLNGQVAAIDGMLLRSDAKLRSIPRKEIRLAELERNAQGSEATYSMLQARLKEAEIAAAATDLNVQVMDPGLTPLGPSSPRPLLNVALALLAGGLVGVSGAFARQYADRSLRTREELLLTSGVPVLGVIPRMSARKARLPARRTPSALALAETFVASEAYSRVATNLAFLAPDAPLKTLVVTSALAGDGKTTVATNLALALARGGKRVLLIDADLRAGRVATTLHVARQPGLAELLAGRADLSAAPASVGVGDGRELHVLVAGSFPESPGTLLGSDRARALLDWARTTYDKIIIDTPPVNAVADAAVLASVSDGVLLVARAGVTGREALALAMEQLRIVRAPVAGAVLNDVDLRRDPAYDQTYRYYGSGQSPALT